MPVRTPQPTPTETTPAPAETPGVQAKVEQPKVEAAPPGASGAPPEGTRSEAAPKPPVQEERSDPKAALEASRVATRLRKEKEAADARARKAEEDLKRTQEEAKAMAAERLPDETPAAWLARMKRAAGFDDDAAFLTDLLDREDADPVKRELSEIKRKLQEREDAEAKAAEDRKKAEETGKQARRDNAVRHLAEAELPKLMAEQPKEWGVLKSVDRWTLAELAADAWDHSVELQKQGKRKEPLTIEEFRDRTKALIWRKQVEGLLNDPDVEEHFRKKFATKVERPAAETAPAKREEQRPLPRETREPRTLSDGRTAPAGDRRRTREAMLEENKRASDELLRRARAQA